MSFWEELSDQTNLAFETFKKFINRNLKFNKNFLKQSFWLAGGDLRTPLNHLIFLHTEKNDLNLHISYLLQMGSDLNLEQSLHLAYELGKFDLVEFIFEAQEKLEQNTVDKFNFKTPALDLISKEGLTLLHLIIDKKNLDHLIFLIKKEVNVNQVSKVSEPNGKHLLVQPLHEAVIKNFPEAIKPLINAGAQVFNPCGSLEETPLLLAARLNHIKVIASILETQNHRCLEEQDKHKPNFLKMLLHKENRNKQRAIEVLCEHLKEKKFKKEALAGIAMLLCRGSDVPRDSVLRNLLKEYRIELLKEIEIYLKQFPSLTPRFLKKCHDKSLVLHEIIYEKSSWWGSLRYLFDEKADCTVFNLESLVEKNEDLSSLFTKKELLFSQFLNHYKKDLRSKACCFVSFFNPFSTMLSLIKEGKITDWDDVKLYAKNNPDSRTDRIVKKMKLDAPQEEINEEEISSNQFSL